MTRTLAPSWLSRKQRRHVDRALRKLVLRGACSICGSPFQPNSPTAGGFDAKGNVVLAGECCTSRLAEIFMMGIDFRLPAGIELQPTSEQIADIAQRSGVGCALQVSSGGPWKDIDRTWFEQNPARTHRIRHPFRGEFDEEIASAPADHALIVLVRQVEPGSRIRGWLYHNTELLPSDEEAVAHALFEISVGREPVPRDGAAYCALIEKYMVPQEPEQ